MNGYLSQQTDQQEITPNFVHNSKTMGKLTGPSREVFTKKL
jgi:hypothetical protein